MDAVVSARAVEDALGQLGSTVLQQAYKRDDEVLSALSGAMNTMSKGMASAVERVAAELVERMDAKEVDRTGQIMDSLVALSVQMGALNERMALIEARVDGAPKARRVERDHKGNITRVVED